MKETTENSDALVSPRYMRIPEDEVDRIVDLIEPTGAGPLRVLDPRCGNGVALGAIQQALESRFGIRVVTFGAEADRERAEEARQRIGQCLQAPYQEARWEDEVMDLMLLNPPRSGGQLELQFLRDTQSILRRGGILFYVIRQESLNGYIAARLAEHFDVLSVYPFLPENYTERQQIVIVARRRPSRTDQAMKAKLRAFGRQAQAASSAPGLPGGSPMMSDRPFGYPDARFEVEARGGRAFYLRHREVTPDELVADAERFGVRTTRWWRDRMITTRELESSTLLPLRDTQIANLLFLGFADNRRFDLEGRSWLFRGQTHLTKTDATTEEDREAGRIREQEIVQQGGVLLDLDTGNLRQVDASGMLSLVQLHADTFAEAVTSQVRALREEMTLFDWEDRVLDQVYRHKRLPGRSEYGLTHVQRVVAAVTAQAIEERQTRAVVLNMDTGSGVRPVKLLV